MDAKPSETDKLRQVLDVARQMAATTDLDVLLRTIIEAACRVLDCERATVFLYDGETDELYSRVATGDAEIRFAADAGIAGTAASERETINVADAYNDDRFNRDIDKKTGFRTRNLLTFPLENLDGDLVGVLQALNKLGGPFVDSDEEMAGALSAQAGVALHRWFLLEEYAEKQRLARDMDIARGIQQAMLPDGNPLVDRYEIAGWNKPADETGGDCYDFLPLSHGRLAVILADATGHGIGAALIIAQCRSLIRATLSVTDDLETVACRVNELLADDLSESRFVTAFIGILDPMRNEMQYVSGGQGPLLFLPGEGEVDGRPASGLPFGVMREAPYTLPPPFCFEPDSTLVLMTDGFFETADADQNLFGEQRVTDLVGRHRDLQLSEVVQKLHDAVVEFSAGQPQTDDLTAVLIRRRT